MTDEKKHSTKFYKKRKNNQNDSSRYTIVNPTRGPIAQRIMTHLKYNDNQIADGVRMDWIYNLNSIQDPNRTGGGHQPYGHDTYATLYNRYRVHACLVKVTFVVLTTGTYKYIIGANNSLSAYTSGTLAAESPNFSTNAFTVSTPRTYTHNYVLNVITGQTPAEYNGDDRYQAVFGSDPVEDLGLHIMMSDFSNTLAVSSTTAFTITLDYVVELFDPKELSQS